MYESFNVIITINYYALLFFITAIKKNKDLLYFGTEFIFQNFTFYNCIREWNRYVSDIF